MDSVICRELGSSSSSIGSILRMPRVSEHTEECAGVHSFYTVQFVSLANCEIFGNPSTISPSRVRVPSASCALSTMYNGVEGKSVNSMVSPRARTDGNIRRTLNMLRMACYFVTASLIPR